MDQLGNGDSFDCFLVGEHSLMVACGELLLELGHRVHGVVSPDPELRRWAEDQGLSAVDFDVDLAEHLGRTTFDYLFSIANLRMLPEEVLALPKKLAINFHDALLPENAGVHATTWAILNREKRHGVTWHVMTGESDTGDILKQRQVVIAETDTSYTLNTKCYEAAYTTFGELVDELATGRETRVPQDLTRRTYHGRFKRPAHAGVFDWSLGARDLSAAVRATDFGGHVNEFGTVTLATDNEFVVVCESEPLATRSSEAPGVVLTTADDGLTVSTVDHDVRLTRLTSVAGQPLTSDKLAALCGRRFSKLAATDAEAVTETASAILRHEAFWVDRLIGLQPLEVPYWDARASAATTRYELAVPTPRCTGLDSGTSLLTAFLAFLARVAREDQFDVGLRWRPDPAPDNSLDSLFADFVPLRVSAPAEGQNFTQFHQKLARWLQATERRRTYRRDVWSRYPQLREHARTFEGLPIAIELVPNLDTRGVCRPDTALLVRIQRDGGGMRWVVANNSLSKLAAERMRQDFTIFLDEVVKSRERDLTQIPLLSEDERRQLAGWNDTAVAYPRDICAHQLFTTRARERPEATALIFNDRTMTYRELDRRSSQVAAFLGRQGIGLGSLVGIYLERSCDLVVSLLGVMKSGAAYVPLDPIYPSDRIGHMLADTGLPLLLTQASLADSVPEGTAEVVLVDRQWDEIQTACDDLAYDRATPDSLAYVIYTSGSTGRPKGVRVRHKGLTNFLCSMANTPGFTEHDRLLAVTTTCFDIAALELFLPLVTGGEVALAPTATASDGFALRRLLAASRATVVQATPSTWKMLIEAGWTGDAGLKVLSGGEALPRDLARELNSRAGQVWNLYGPTETTIWSSVDRVTTEQITIGRPIANTQFHVLDKRKQLVPPGVPGELYIGGEGVADGYLDRPELTAEKFVLDPFGPPGTTLYRTGDLVRRLGDGRLEYLERIDNQIKLHGYRIELGEVEDVLRSHPSVREAIVVLHESTVGAKRLVAYLIPETWTDKPSSADLREHLWVKLPDYMIPATFVTVDDIPLTGNGKVDRKTLSGRAIKVASREAPVVPGTQTERVIAEIWRSTLGVGSVGLDDNFFQVGGNSLLLIRVVKQLQATVSQSLTRVDMFQYPTIRTMSRFLNRSPQEEASDHSAHRQGRGSLLTRGRRLDAATKQQENRVQDTSINE
ncbi:amino acid adenylation domain-containing protein [Amycolatopsis sp. NPDC049868]|uniref:amino acid adenylation domain-containing protein n=1 Tax=Amycolatopsis sp. NPDC049868 TaxID=3363934 RepID=UPI00378A0A59